MKKAAWLLPSLLEGSGGHRTILQNAQFLTENGYICDLYIENNGQFSNENKMLKQVERLFGETSCNVKLGFNVEGEYDIVFATAWYTADVVHKLQTTAKKAYFVQDFEALFNPMGDGYIMAMNTYSYGLYPITIGRWLSRKLKSEYLTDSQYFDFCYDATIYRPLDSYRENAICFIYQPEKPRRCHRLATKALGIVKCLRPDVKIYLYGSKVKDHVWFEHENLGLISVSECNSLYNKCRVGLCVSASNPSRIPFEMMAAGLPVVDLYMENNLYDMPEYAILLARHTPESIAKAIIEILDNEQLQADMSKNGKVFMSDKTLMDGYKQFLEAVENIIGGCMPDIDDILPLYSKPAVVADAAEYIRMNVPIDSLPPALEKGLMARLKRNGFLRNNCFVRITWAMWKRLVGGVR